MSTRRRIACLVAVVAGAGGALTFACALAYPPHQRLRYRTYGIQVRPGARGRGR